MQSVRCTRITSLLLWGCVISGKKKPLLVALLITLLRHRWWSLSAKNTLFYKWVSCSQHRLPDKKKKKRGGGEEEEGAFSHSHTCHKPCLPSEIKNLAAVKQCWASLAHFSCHEATNSRLSPSMSSGITVCTGQHFSKKNTIQCRTQVRLLG